MIVCSFWGHSRSFHENAVKYRKCRVVAFGFWKKRVVAFEFWKYREIAVKHRKYRVVAFGFSVFTVFTVFTRYLGCLRGVLGCSGCISGCWNGYERASSLKITFVAIYLAFKRFVGARSGRK